MTRKYTNKLLEMVEMGVIAKDTMITNLLSWMSEDDVREFYDVYYALDEDEDND